MEQAEDRKTERFEEKLQFVETLTESIESGKLSLEESVAAYEQGMKMLAELDRNLEEINRKLTILRDGREVPMADAGI